MQSSENIISKRTAFKQEIFEFGVQAIKERLFSHGAFWTGNLDQPHRDIFGSFDSRDSATDTIYDLSSMTKALSTTVLSLRAAWSRGRSETDTLGSIFSQADFSGMEAAASLTLADVLRHEAGLPAWRNFYVMCNGERQDIKDVLGTSVASRHLDRRNVYSDIGMILLGYLLESHCGKTLSELFDELLMQDLNLDPQSLKLGPARRHVPEYCVDTGFCAIRGRLLRGETHDENSSAMGGFTGHTGLFGSAAGVVQYLRALDLSRIGRQVIRANCAWSAAHPTSDSALGWRTGRDASSNTFGEGRGIGHLGFTGTAFWLDPKTKRFGVLLTNRVALSRLSSQPAMRVFRRDVFGKMYQYLEATQL